MTQLSIIVPVYKTEKFLCRCIDSILNQEFEDFELILVNDGSPDKCPEICNSYSEKDHRVKVIHKTNNGVASARNSGLDIAIGNYVTFVDSDDWIEPNMYREMMDIANRFECDIVMCDCVKDFPDHSEIYTHNIRAGFYSFRQLKAEYYPHLLMMENVEYPPTISNWLCLFRQNNNTENVDNKDDCQGKRQNLFSSIRYIEGVRYSEDLLFGSQKMIAADSFYYMKGSIYYHYCINYASATHIIVLDKWKDYSKIYKVASEFFLMRSDYDFQHQLDLMLLFFIYNTTGDICSSQINTTEKKKMIKEILNQPSVIEMFKRISINKLNISWKLKIRTWLYKYKVIIV